MSFYLFSKYNRSLILILNCILGCLAISGCTPSTNEEFNNELKKAQASDTTGISMLVNSYCGGCHLVPKPEHLPKRIWQKEVLPKMGAFMGIYQDKSRIAWLEQSPTALMKLEESNIFPKQPRISKEDWNRIKDYFIEISSNEIEYHTSQLNIKRSLFDVVSPQIRIRMPMSTLIDYKELQNVILHSDVKKDYSTLNIFETNGKIRQAIALRSPVVAADFKGDTIYALLMGDFTSTDSPTGSLVRISKSAGKKKYNSIETVIDSLQRPIDLSYADFDGDDDEDIVIAEFGNWTGGLTWYEQTESNIYQRHKLLNVSGITTVNTEDLDNDDDIDIMALVTQGQETLWAFLNDGKGNFTTKKLIQFAPSYGSVYFDYVDLDGDNIRDIIHVAGDNADYEPILKPYHGIRIFKGAPNLTFTEVYFYPQNGSYKAIPSDFDNDGDIDIACLSFFPDYQKKPTESLVMLWNEDANSSFTYRAEGVAEVMNSRWIVMDAGDINQDSKTDLILGAFIAQNPYGKTENLQKQWVKNSPIFSMLINNKN